MRVLYLCHRIPYPPNKGDKIRAFHQVRAISSEHEVDLFTLADDPSDLAKAPALAKYCRDLQVARIDARLARLRSLPFLLTDKPLTVPYFYSAELAARVRAAAQTRSYDRIFIYCSAMAQYAAGIQGVPMIADFVDVDSEKWAQHATIARFPLSWVYRREARLLRRYERSICEKAACVVVSTEREASLLRNISSKSRVEVVPNGVDTSYFDPGTVPRETGPATIVFTGDMAYFPNQHAVVWFANEVLPLIRQSVADARFLIVGRNPGPNVLRLRNVAGVEVTGFVPDVRAYLAKAHVAVAPFSIAAGIQNKILEAMAFGLPVVCTSRTAQGLSRRLAAAVEVADEPWDMASAITRLLTDRELASRKGNSGGQIVADEYQWGRALARLLKIIESPANLFVA